MSNELNNNINSVESGNANFPIVQEHNPYVVTIVEVASTIIHTFIDILLLPYRLINYFTAQNQDDGQNTEIRDIYEQNINSSDGDEVKPEVNLSPENLIMLNTINQNILSLNALITQAEEEVNLVRETLLKVKEKIGVFSKLENFSVDQKSEFEMITEQHEVIGLMLAEKEHCLQQHKKNRDLFIKQKAGLENPELVNEEVNNDEVKSSEPVNPLELVAKLLFKKIGIEFNLEPGPFNIQLTERQLRQIKIDKVPSVEGTLDDMKSGAVIGLGFQSSKSKDGYDEIAEKTYCISGEYFKDENRVRFDKGLVLLREVDTSMLPWYKRNLAPKIAYSNVSKMEYIPGENGNPSVLIMETTKDLTTYHRLGGNVTKDAIHISKTALKAEVTGTRATYRVKKDYDKLVQALEGAKVVANGVQAIKDAMKSQ